MTKQDRNTSSTYSVYLIVSGCSMRLLRSNLLVIDTSSMTQLAIAVNR